MKIQRKHVSTIIVGLIFMAHSYDLYKNLGWVNISFRFFPASLYLMIQAYLAKELIDNVSLAIKSKFNMLLVIVAIFMILVAVLFPT
jgi:hypothetical protein